MNKLKLFVRAVSFLMLIAFVFGIVAFVDANKTGDLKNLYKENSHQAINENMKIEADDARNSEIIPVAINKIVDKKVNLTDKKITLKDESIAKKKPTNKKNRLSIKKSKKTLSFKSFSRGSLERIPIDKIEITK
jgi:hypothetical protein